MVKLIRLECISEVEPTELTDGSHVEHEKKEVLGMILIFLA